MISDKQWKHLYDAAKRYEQSSVEGRDLETWVKCVSDWGLEDAEWALSAWLETESNRLNREIAKVAKLYHEAGVVDARVASSFRCAVEALITFEKEYAEELDKMEKVIIF